MTIDLGKLSHFLEEWQEKSLTQKTWRDDRLVDWNGKGGPGGLPCENGKLSIRSGLLFHMFYLQWFLYVLPPIQVQRCSLVCFWLKLHPLTAYREGHG